MSTSSFLPAAFEHLLSASVAAAVLIVIIGGLQIVLRKRLSPAWRFCLWMPVLLRLLVPVFPESSFSLLNAPKWFARPEPQVEGIPETPPGPPRLSEEIQTDLVEFPEAEAQASAVPVASAQPSAPFPWKAALAILWLGGASAFLLRLAIGWCWLSRRLARESGGEPRELTGIMESAAEAAGVVAPAICLTKLVDSPALFGLLHPRLLLPEDFAAKLDARSIRHVFLHESAHLKRRDLILNTLMMTAQALHWMNPLVWLACRQMRLERELACDEMAMQISEGTEAKAYGATILQLLEGSDPRRPLPALIGIAEEKYATQRRLREIAAFQRNKRSHWLVLPVFALLSVAGLTNAQRPDSTTPERSKGWLFATIDHLDVEGMMLPEVLELFRKKLPEPHRDIEFFWREYTNIVSVDAAGFISTRIAAANSAAHLKIAPFEIRNASAFEVLNKITHNAEKQTGMEVSGRIVTFFDAAQPRPQKKVTVSDPFIEEQKMAARPGPAWSFQRLNLIPGAEREWPLRFSEVPIASLKAEGTMPEVLESFRKTLPEPYQNVEFFWRERTNLVGEATNGVVYGVNAVGYISTRIGADATPGDQLKIAPFEISNGTVLDVLNRISLNAERRLGMEMSGKHIMFFEAPKPEPEKKVAVSVLVNDARLLIEMGKLVEAEAKLKEAQKSEPENRAVFYYLTQIKEKRYTQEARKREVLANEKIVVAEDVWNVPPNRDWLLTVNPYARTNTANFGRGRQAIQRKLEGIVLDQFSIPRELPLSEVVKELDAEVKKRDVDRRGLNFIISSHLDRPGPVGVQGGAIDPLTGQPTVPTATDAPIVVEDFLVKIDPPLRNVRLAEVLSAITRVAKPPQGLNPNISLTFSVEEYAIVFSQRAANAEPLYTRSFRVDSNALVSGLDGVFQRAKPPSGVVRQGGGGVTGGGGIIGVTVTNSPSSLTDSMRNFFIAAGIDFQTNQFAPSGQHVFGGPIPAQKAIFFNERTGVLFVRATLRDLDIVERALQTLDLAPPPQATFEVRSIHLKSSEQLADVLNLMMAAAGELRPILTDREFRKLDFVLRQDEQYQVVDMPRVTTLSGRAARVEVEEKLAVDIMAQLDHDFIFNVKASGYEPANKERNVTGEGVIYDGQTFVLGLPKVMPSFLGDRPELGRVFEAMSPKHLIFITVTRIDPAGNRINKPDDLPFDPEKIPSQLAK